ncbi:hypothetical protein CYMTET_9919 [Cymbomonas tetramitiformis]|uniref:Uncharacterized protein n=1 Tax=Cymbomonas tetramitiformis TaxID=36881 RepID=A0AAE0GQU2_9CHLO|nr:hypothetical protein CYMTET_9919 [Cymbomonas tetramitiformis]
MAAAAPRERNEAAEDAARIALSPEEDIATPSLDSAEPADTNPEATLDLTLSPSSYSQQANSGDTADFEDSQRSLNFTQQLMERQLAAARSDATISGLTAVTEQGVEPTPLNPIQEETHLELLLTIQKQQRHRLRPILEGDEAVAAPVKVTNAPSSHHLEEESTPCTHFSEPEITSGEEEEEEVVP